MIPIKPALYAIDPDAGMHVILLRHPNSAIYKIASKVVAIVNVEQVNEKCRKIDCVIIRDAFDAFLKLICDLFKCCFKKCLKSS